MLWYLFHQTSVLKWLLYSIDPETSWRHDMETLSSLMALLWGESIGRQGIPLTKGW